MLGSSLIIIEVSGPFFLFFIFNESPALQTHREEVTWRTIGDTNVVQESSKKLTITEYVNVLNISEAAFIVFHYSNTKNYFHNLY